MTERTFRVSVSRTAKRDLNNEILWLLENRSKPFARRFRDLFDQLLQRLAAHPEVYQALEVVGRPVRRAVLEGRWIVLYEVFPADQEVLILAVRGAAEDWMNTPVSD